jgi:hypothetical protein
MAIQIWRPVSAVILHARTLLTEMLEASYEHIRVLVDCITPESERPYPFHDPALALDAERTD